jgi:acyl-CoA dehydrogenase
MAFQSSVPNRPIPFSEPPYLLNLPSPYYRASHFSWQQACRAFVAKNLLQHAFEWENEGDVPSHVFETFSDHNVLIANLPAPLPVEWLKRLGVHDVLGVVRVEDWDYFHTAIFADEV